MPPKLYRQERIAEHRQQPVFSFPALYKLLNKLPLGGTDDRRANLLRIVANR